MHTTTLLTTPARGEAFVSVFDEPSPKDSNEYTRSRIRREIRLFKDSLEIHGYLLRKLSHREVWRIGSTDNLYLLSYQFDPEFAWILFPGNANLQSILADCSTPRLMNRNTAIAHP